MEQDYVIEPALGPRSLEGHPPRPPAAPSLPVPPVPKRQFGSPVRPLADASHASSGQQPRPSTQQDIHQVSPLEDHLASRPTTAAACLEQVVPVTPPPADEYPVVADDPMMDESPESMAVCPTCNCLVCPTFCKFRAEAWLSSKSLLTCGLKCSGISRNPTNPSTACRS